MPRPDFKDQLVSAIPSLRAFARSLSRDRCHSDDLVQETLVRAWAHRGGFTPGTNLRAWLFTILRNAHYTHLRKRRREVEDVDGGLTAALATPPDQIDRIELDRFLAVLETLSPDQREAIILVGASGFSHDEAAAICGCAAGTMKSRVSRARAALMKALDMTGRSDFEPDPVTAGVLLNRLAA